MIIHSSWNFPDHAPYLTSMLNLTQVSVPTVLLYILVCPLCSVLLLFQTNHTFAHTVCTGHPNTLI